MSVAKDARLGIDNDTGGEMGCERCMRVTSLGGDLRTCGGLLARGVLGVRRG